MALFMVLFAVIAFYVSFLISRPNNLDRGAVAAYVTLVAWGSLMCGLFMARLQP